MIFCCEPFRNLVGKMGERGLAAILVRELGITYFCLQSRGVTASEIAGLQGEAGKINLVMQTGIQYCPFCGLKLERWLTKNRKEAEELIKQSEPFKMKFFASQH